MIEEGDNYYYNPIRTNAEEVSEIKDKNLVPREEGYTGTAPTEEDNIAGYRGGGGSVGSVAKAYNWG